MKELLEGNPNVSQLKSALEKEKAKLEANQRMLEIIDDPRKLIGNCAVIINSNGEEEYYKVIDVRNEMNGRDTMITSIYVTTIIKKQMKHRFQKRSFGEIMLPEYDFHVFIQRYNIDRNYPLIGAI